MKRWKTSELKYIKENLHLSDKELADHFSVSISSLSGIRKRYGLMKGKERGRFKKGMIPQNKGKKISSEMYEKLKPTMFKKGHKPANYRKPGETFTAKDSRTGKMYKFIKLPHNRQYPYARYIYEKMTGEKLANNEVIRFKDGNTLNHDFTNLQKISRVKHMKLNHNREKASEGMKCHWIRVMTYEIYGIKTSRHNQLKNNHLNKSL